MSPVEILKKHWGYDSFRPCQREIIESVLAGHDTLGLLPTGGGKSITFQVPALMLEGMTVVVSPLVSLMKDQVDNLRQRRVMACYLYAGLTRREVKLVYDRCRLGKARLLYVSPERLRSERFIDELRRWHVSLLVVDEAHCISQWGYDFRPPYLKIAELRKVVGADVPVLALTASATPAVRADIIENLNFRPGYTVHLLSFARGNISFIMRQTAAKAGKLLEVLSNTQGSAIVYVRSRQKTRQMAEMLTASGISAACYHAGLIPEEKSERQEAWKSGKIRVMVATNAFGMGIDKPDVRTVVHLDIPPSLEEYYQEAGRAGRDGLPSFAVMIASAADKRMLTRRLNEAFPPRDYVAHVYELLGAFLEIPVGEGYNTVREFDLARFCQIYGLQEGPVRGALALLTQSGYIEFMDDAPTRSRLMMTCRRDELYAERLDDADDRVLNAVLRLYTGIFADYQPVSEGAIARAAEMPEADVYPSMLSLGRHGILHYIPRKAIPYVYYVTAREETRHVQLPRAIYDVRRELMRQRLEAVRAFVFDGDRCRQQMMLEYFGEKDTEPCGCCDYCRRMKVKSARAAEKPEVTEAREQRLRGGLSLQQAILHVLKSGPMEFAVLAGSLQVDARRLVEPVRELADEGLVEVVGTRVSLIQD